MTLARDRRGRLWVGTSGWQYEHWRGRFYPRRLSRQDWFLHYAAHFETVEINSTFYGLPASERFDAWREAAPPGFLYALKFSRYATHLKHLKEPRPALREFLGRARRLRDRRWLGDATLTLLRQHGVALCIHDACEDHPREVTGDFVYLRFHGPRARSSGSYSPQRLAAEARRIRAWLRRGLDVHAYFNNDVGGAAVRDALALRRYLRGAGEGRVARSGVGSPDALRPGRSA